MRFISKEGEWWPVDNETKQELAKAKIDHLGIHISEDPYVKNLEFVTGVSKKELMANQQQAILQQMQMRSARTSEALALALMGDKEGAARVLKEIRSAEVVEKQAGSNSDPKIAKLDRKQMAEKEFEESMGGKPAKTSLDTSNLPERVEEEKQVHESVGVGDSARSIGVDAGLGKAPKVS